jgi:hypothetical protein
MKIQISPVSRYFGFEILPSILVVRWLEKWCVKKCTAFDFKWGFWSFSVSLICSHLATPPDISNSK